MSESRYSAHWCKACGTYFAIGLHRTATGDYALWCPRCDRPHFRQFINGQAVSCDPPGGPVIDERSGFEISRADAESILEGERIIALKAAKREQAGRRPRQMTPAELDALPVVTNNGRDLGNGFRVPPSDFPTLGGAMRADDIARFRDGAGVWWGLELQHGAWCRRRVP
jgi:hypothetical protein